MQNLSTLNQKTISFEFSQRDNLKKSRNIDEKQIDIILNKDRFIKITTLNQIDSTNNEAKRYIKNIDENNTALVEHINNSLCVFAADIQTEGRGRRGNKWLSSNKQSLSVSFLTAVNDDLENLPPITAAAALAVKDTFKKFNLNTTIKWPNDILVNNKKIAGILSELVLSQKEKAYLIIGCGMNLNNKSFVKTIDKKATSYFKETGLKLDKNIFLVELIKNINYYIDEYFHGKRKKIIKKWKRNLNIVSKYAVLIQQGVKYDVLIKDVLDNGEILAELKDGSLKRFQSYNTSFKYTSI